MSDNTKQLLISQMKRAIELLEDKAFSVHSGFAEFERKMHEIRRDSVRLVKELKPWKK